MRSIRLVCVELGHLGGDVVLVCAALRREPFQHLSKTLHTRPGKRFLPNNGFFRRNIFHMPRYHSLLSPTEKLEKLLENMINFYKIHFNTDHTIIKAKYSSLSFAKVLTHCSIKGLHVSAYLYLIAISPSRTVYQFIFLYI